MWRAIVNELRNQRKELLADALAHGRVLQLSPGTARIGYTAMEGLFRSTAQRGLKDALVVLEKILGVPTGLTIETVTADESGPSMAQADGERARAREERILRESREHPAVLAAMKIFGGTVEHVRVLEEVNEPSEFVPAPEDGEEAEG